jgi:hypothetical protein
MLRGTTLIPPPGAGTLGARCNGRWPVAGYCLRFTGEARERVRARVAGSHQPPALCSRDEAPAGAALLLSFDASSLVSPVEFPVPETSWWS